MSLDPEGEKVLLQVYRLGALSLDQMTRLMFMGDRERCYRKIAAMSDGGWLKSFSMSRDKRERFVTLTTQGAAFVVDWLRSDPRNPKYIPPKRERAIKVIMGNEFYVRAVECGLPEGVCLSRREALARYAMDPQKVPLSWFLEAGEARYAIYVPSTVRFREPLRKSLLEFPKRVGVSHVLVQATVPRWRADRKAFLEDAPTGDFHVINYTHLPLLVESLRNPQGGLDLLKERLRVVAPGGRIYPSRDLMLPPWVLERRTRFLMGDMRLENVGLGARLLTHTQESLKSQGYEGVILLVSTVQQAKEWAKLLGMRDWYWFIVQSDAPEECLWRVKDGTLRRVHVKPKGGVAKDVVQSA